jgi:hypothetical protein
MKTKKSGNAFIPFPRFWLNRGKGRKTLIYTVAAAFLIHTLFLVTASHFRYPSYRQYVQEFDVGEVAQRELVAEQTIRFVDTRETEKLRERKAETVPPVYMVRETEVLKGIDELEEIAGILSTTPPPGAEKLQEQLKQDFGVELTESQAEYLRSERGRSSVLPISEQILQDLLSQGIVPASPRIGTQGKVELWRWEDGEKLRVTLSENELLSMQRVENRAERALRELSISQTERNLIVELTGSLARPTAYFNASVTEARKEEARRSVRPVIGRIFEGETIVERGEVITENAMRKIEVIRANTPRLETGEVIADLLFIIGIFFLGYVLCYPLVRNTHRTIQNGVLLFSLSVAFSLNVLIVVLFSLVPPSLPFALGVLTVFYTMLVSILIKRRVGVIMSLLLSLLFMVLPDVGMYSFLFSFFSGIIAAYIIQNAEKRIDLVTGTVKVAAVITALLVVIGLMQEESVAWFAKAAGIGIINAGISGGLLLATLPIFEHMLNAPTVFRLRELSETNTPIFKRMITIAPGTYSHSIGVAHLAESACREIGANELVARVGAYYHDIGKMDQPEYFIENQTDYNRHDEISPNLSVAVIKSHVKLGKEKAKELKLPPEIVEIVADHHGSDVINYFYHQAKEQAKGPVGPEKFSYNGVPPRSKEAAVVMLADTIEAQSRTVKKPTMQRFEKMVWDAIMYKFNNKQLSNCDLSMKELELIKRSFVQILAGQFHSRIEYPNTRELG